MYKKTNKNRQLSLHTSVSQYLTGVSYEHFEDNTGWQNVFFKQVTSKIDEDLFKVLFSSDTGSPNASICTAIAMMIIKEVEGCSDKKLFESCRFNLLTRKSLCIINIDDPIPSESTYYLLRNKIQKHFENTEVDLFAECFKDITKKQIAEFDISGESIRMDSKLIGSNIAFYSRYELVHKTLVHFYKKTSNKIFDILSPKDKELLKEFVKEKSSKTVYTSNKEQIKDKLQTIGNLIYTVINSFDFKNNESFKILKRVFKDQYQEEDSDKIIVRPSNEISAKSVQSPFDSDCDFRKKNEEVTKGYNHNLTETVSDSNEFDLITDVKMEKATYADNDFLEPSIKSSKKILKDDIEKTHADGAYNSDRNQEFIKEENINFHLTGFQGQKGRYDLNLINNKLEVFDNQENKKIDVVKIKNGNYRIKTEKGYRYFTEKNIKSCELRREVDALPYKIKNKRNNVEATIYQLAYHLRKDKTKYRGYFKNKIWAILRVLWVNCVRISKYISNLTIEIKKNNLFFSFSSFFRNFVFFSSFFLDFVLLKLINVKK